jgi:four helix bundle protein
VGTNYIKENKSLSKKNFFVRIKICRKEAKESAHCLKLSSPTKPHENTKLELMCESEELTKIFSAIMRKVKV